MVALLTGEIYCFSDATFQMKYVLMHVDRNMDVPTRRPSDCSYVT